MPAERPAYAIGAGFVVHQNGRRLSLRRYLQKQIANLSRGDDSVRWLREQLAQLDAAIVASWPEQLQREAAQ